MNAAKRPSAAHRAATVCRASLSWPAPTALNLSLGACPTCEGSNGHSNSMCTRLVEVAVAGSAWKTRPRMFTVAAPLASSSRASSQRGPSTASTDSACDGPTTPASSQVALSGVIEPRGATSGPHTDDSQCQRTATVDSPKPQVSRRCTASAQMAESKRLVLRHLILGVGRPVRDRPETARDLRKQVTGGCGC